MADTINTKPIKRELKFSPSQVLVIGFASVILTGTILLSMPFASARGHFTSFVDALFTSTSAVCVTGLIVVDTAKHFSTLGKVIIILLIQIGGLGYMTLTTLMFILFNRKLTIRDKLNIKEGINQFTLSDLATFVKYILKITLLIEGAACLVLTIHWSRHFPLKEALGHAIFHSVSAFCNAGFSTFSTNLSSFVSDVVVSLTITSLIILGGLGYIVVNELHSFTKGKRISAHARLVITVTSLLLVIGTILIFLFEFNNIDTLRNLPLGQKILASYFQAVTPRTAGFSTINTGYLQPFTLFLIIILMFIGASPGGTGGGIKTTTFGVVISSIWTTLRGRTKVNIFKRQIPSDTIRKSLSLTYLSLILVSIVSMGLLMTQKATFLRILFEVVSAFGTVGLSAATSGTVSLAGIFSNFGKILLIMTMYFGRVGPLTIGIALFESKKQELYSYAEENVLIG